jgi:YHS domain-containing protein
MRHRTRWAFVGRLLMCAVPLLAALPARLVSQSSSPVFQVDGLALRGYDVVSYFDGKAEPGLATFEATHAGATWRFTSAAHRDRFMQAPDRFVPQYGGYCALGMAHGGAVPTDPAAYTVHDGKLYLNSNRLSRITWAYAKDWMISRADPNWTQWLARASAAAPSGASAAAAQRRQPRATTDSLLAVGGLDATTYFDPAGPVAGDSAIVTTWNGRTWRFRTTANRDRFVATPARFAPQFGGLSPLILAHGDRVPGDPRLFTIVGGKIYLDVAAGPQQTFRRNPDRLVARADSLWRAAGSR